jgi:serine/threonine-protein kinase
MPNPHLIGLSSLSAPDELKRTQASARTLPDDLLREASQRLGVMSLLAAILWLVASVLDHLAAGAMSHGDPRWARFWPTDSVSLGGILISLALFTYTRKRDRNPRFILDLGLVYMVLMALGLGVIMHWDPVPAHFPIFPMFSWIGVTVLMFAAIVPNSATKTLIAGLIAVSMNPLGMFIARARGSWDFGPASYVLVMHYPDYLLVGIAVVISRVVTRLGQQVTRAREMGSYQLGELLGSGGMGEVYKATHRMLARPAAIKLIRREMLGAGEGEAARLAIKRFRREAEAAANLRSPHTVELYDFGVTEDQTFYFVMELLEGMNLEVLVRQKGPVPAGRAIFILRQVCESLEEAHVRGLVHRDIKPANIHVGRLGLRHDFVKVLDFGLVKSVADGGNGHSLATAAGLTPGTPAYMAPEMARGEKVDGRADLYAVGCVAYHLLTGQLVFEASNGLQMILKHMQDQPVPPSQRTELPVPGALDRLVLACLAKAPHDRPQSAAELASSLDAIDVEPWSEELAMHWWRINQPS